MFTLEILDKIRHGTLDLGRPRDLVAAAPLIHLYAEHDQAEIIEALFKENLETARARGGIPLERDTYWQILHDTQERFNPVTHPNLTRWVLEKYRTSPHAAHSPEEIILGEQAEQEQTTHPDRPIPVKRHGKFSHFLKLEAILKYSIIARLDEPALEVARLIARDFRPELKQSLGYSRGRVLELKPGDTHAYKKFFPRTPDEFRRSMKISGQTDAILGTKHTALEFIKSGLVPALAAAANPEIRAFMIREATRMSVPHKRDLIENYAYYAGSDSAKSICGTIDYQPWVTLMTGPDTDRLARWHDLLREWQARDPRQDYLQIFHKHAIKNLVQSVVEDYQHGTFRTSLIVNKFSPQLPWAEVAHRLECLTPHTGKDMHKVDFEQNDYIYAAMIRAVRFGHAGDLLETMYYCKSLSYSEQEERNFEDGYPAGFPDAHYSFERISRDPEIIDILIKHFSVFKWTEAQGYDGSTLSKVLSLVSKESDQASFDHAAASYVSRGQAMPPDEISAYYDQVFPFMAEVLGTVDAETRASVIDDVFFSGYKSPLVKSLEALLENRDHKGHAYWVDAAYAYTDAKDAQTIINSQLDAALRQNSNLRGLRFTADFLRQVKGLDQALYDDKLKAVKNNRFSRDNGEAALLLTLLDEPIPDKWQIIPAVKAVPAILARATPAEDHIATLAKLCFQEMGDTLGTARPRLNPTVYAQLKPLLKMTATIEGNGDADAQNNLSEGQAYKLATLFGTLRKADSFIRHHAQPGRQPVHDVCLFNLPYEGHWTPDIWGNLAIRYGHAVTKYLGFAPKVEDFVQDLNRRRRTINLDRLGKTGAGINDRTLRLPELKPAMLRAIVNRIGYDRSRENKQAADLCLRLGVESSYFNKTLDLLAAFEKAAKKPRDRMPTITIDGKDLGLEGHKFSRVARGDVLNLWIGKVVNCCNHLAGDGSQMARAQFEGSTNALYIIRDSRNRPEAKLSGWLSTQSTIVFNAWERLSAEQDFLMTRFVMAAGIQILKKYPRIREVRLGAGPINKAAVPFALAEETHTPVSKDAWTGDSHTQFVIASRGRLPQARAMLAGEVKRLMGAEKIRIKMTWEERQAAEAPHLD